MRAAGRPHNKTLGKAKWFRSRAARPRWRPVNNGVAGNSLRSPLPTDNLPAGTRATKQAEVLEAQRQR